MEQTAYFKQIRAKRRGDILKTAKSMFLQEGVDAFTMQKLANELDVSTVTLYKYFENSDAIIRTIREEIVEKVAVTVPETEQDADYLEEILQSIRAAFSKLLVQREDMTLLFLFDVYLRSKKDKEPLHIADESLQNMIQKAQEKGQMRKDKSAEELSRFIGETNLAVAGRISLMAQEEYQEKRKQLQSWIDCLLEMYEGYLRCSV